MPYLSNFHTHTVFCDGADTIDGFVKNAELKHFSALGFSAHSLYPFAAGWHMPLKKYPLYIEEITRLKSTCRSLSIFAGFEADFFPQLTVPDSAAYKTLGADYIIGSVHYLVPDKASGARSNPSLCSAFTVDSSVPEVSDGLERVFNGNGRKMVECYFENIRQMCAYCTFDFVGHADLVRNKNGALHFFDESSSWYQDELRKTARAIADSGKMIEINTGAIARRIMDDLYPSSAFLSELCKNGVRVVINSDAHNCNALNCAFDRARQAALNAGYTDSMHLVNKEKTAAWEPRPLV